MLETISFQLDCQLMKPDYGALRDMIVLRCSLAHNTNTGDNISDPIERIQKVEVKCSYDTSWEKDDATWYGEVSAMLAPLQEVVDTVRVVIY
jgi:hypothetical protein